MQAATIMLSNATIVRAPETGQTPSGTTNLKFTAVVNHGKRDDEQADFYSITVWGRAAETLVMLRDGGSLTKGARVDVVGRLTHRQYKGRDGSDKVSYDINANEVILVSPPKGYTEGGFRQEEPEPDLSQVPF